MAIYKWHVKHALEFASCLDCNGNFISCLSNLFGEDYTNTLYMAAGYFNNNDGSKAIHKWAVVFLQGIGYVFDPRMQKYISPSGTDYFALSRSSSLYKKRFTFEGWYC
ncbi:MAG: hypothetical protein LUG95_02180 [Clostridiales bacterium]|nr:hypothetical protein [Clostridiales bacterium]